MKRLLPLIILLTLLCGCAAKEPTAPETPQAPPVPSVSVPTVVDTEMLQAAYEAVLASSGRTLSVEEAGTGDLTLPLSLGIEQSFLSGEWTAAEQAEWEVMLSAPDRGLLIALSSADGQTAIRCCGDLVMVEEGGEAAWFRAEDDGIYRNFYTMAEEAVDSSVWSVTADGSLSPREAAEKMVEQVAENYRNVPDWVQWKPLDVQVKAAKVFDVYLGEPQQFCAGFGFRVKVEDVMDGRYGYWQAGAGLEEMDEEGYCGYGSQVQVQKNEDGDWAFQGRGTGGCRVTLPRKEGEDNLELLVSDFFLTWGESHDWYIPYAILECSESQMEELPAILARRGEKDAKALCAVLGKCLKEYDYWKWSIESLKGVLGKYGAYLDA